MNTLVKPLLAAMSLFVLSGYASQISAQEEKPRDERLMNTMEIFETIDKGMPDILSEDNSKLAATLLSPKLGKPFTENFNFDRATELLFADGKIDTKKCDDATRICAASEGEAAGEGAYRQLVFQDGETDTSLRFVRREKASGNIQAIKLDDKEAYTIATKLLTEGLSVPVEEIPVAPANARYRLPVKTVNLGYSDGKGQSKSLAVEKLVKVQRGFYVGGDLGWVPGPGKLAVAIDDTGVNSAAVRDWADMSRYGSDLNPANAKPRSQIIEELVGRFAEEGIARLSSARSLIAIALPEGAGSPIPVLRVYASPQERDLDEASQASVVSSAGVIIELPLIAVNDDQLLQEQSE